MLKEGVFIFFYNIYNLIKSYESGLGNFEYYKYIKIVKGLEYR